MPPKACLDRQESPLALFAPMFLSKLDKEFRRSCALAYPLAGMIGRVVMAMASEVQKGAKDLSCNMFEKTG